MYFEFEHFIFYKLKKIIFEFEHFYIFAYILKKFIERAPGVDIWGVCSMGVGPEFAPRSHTLQILFII